MKLVVIGFGQCGGRIADEFSRLNTRARFHRRIDIVVGTFAVNTDVADLDCLSSIGTDYRHRILIGNRKTGGHGVGKANELGAEVAREDGDKVIDAIRSLERLYEADAFLLIAGAAGGTGSGSMPIMAQTIRERWKDKPILSLVALPFEHEEQTAARTYYNTATCLKAVYSVTDAVFLVDNQRYIEKDSSLVNNLTAINKLIAEPFYDLLCAGEEKKGNRIGTKLLDAGDIMRTLGGWTVIGYGTSQLPTFRLPLAFQQRNHYRNKSTETHKGLHAMNQAMSNLTLNCNPRDSASALYLLSAPTAEMNMGLIKELGECMNQAAPEATLRYGDYPRGGNTLAITLILSQLNSMEKIKQYYDKTPKIIQEEDRRQVKSEAKLSELEDASMKVPSLL